MKKKTPNIIGFKRIPPDKIQEHWEKMMELEKIRARQRYRDWLLFEFIPKLCGVALMLMAVGFIAILFFRYCLQLI